MNDTERRVRILVTEPVIFPYEHGSTDITDNTVIEFLKTALAQNERLVFLPAFQQTDGEIKDGAIAVPFRAEQFLSPLSFEGKLVYKAATERVMLTDVRKEADGFYSAVPVAAPPYAQGADETVLRALFKKAEEFYKEFLELEGRDGILFEFETVNPDIDAIVAHIGEADRSAFYADFETRSRLLKVISLLNTVSEILRVDEAVSETVKESIDRNQREYYVRERIKALSEEIDDDDETEEYYQKIDALRASDEIKEKLRKEVRRITKTAPASPEMALLKNYLEVALELPWGTLTDDNDDLKNARAILDQDHYGIEKVKERLIEALAVRKLNKEGRSPIICLVGPPGTGKTSVALSIARAMNKKYVRLSFGGVRDEAEIRGHRKTYVGAMPGRIITGIKTAGSMNPVFLMDEIDKMASDYKGDPADALLEVLDPEQNVNFRDHFLELPFDLSKTLFITTANTTATISRPLLDRMEVIEMSGYTDLEKIEIAKRHLIRKSAALNGVKPEWFSITEAALADIIRLYTRESGVRALEKRINEITRKIALRFVENPAAKKVVVNPKNLSKFLGVAKFEDLKRSKGKEIGVVTGLAWTEVGGDTLEIEVAFTKGKGEIQLTGNLGDVMKESARLAITYCRAHSAELGIADNFFNENDIHIHVPEGATPKDGPSAGVTITTALVSALSGKYVAEDIAMTGEISLRGKVLPIGGLREKTLAALRAGVKTVYIPEENRKDYKELPSTVKEGVDFVFVSDVSEVLRGALC